MKVYNITSSQLARILRTQKEIESERKIKEDRKKLGIFRYAFLRTFKLG